MAESEAKAPRFVTRSEAARILGLTRMGVRALEGKHLHPQKDAKGVYFYSYDEVEAYARRRRRIALRRRVQASGVVPSQDTRTISRDELAAAVFKAFRDGKKPRDIVIDLEVSPETVRRLRDEYDSDLAGPEPLTFAQTLAKRRQDLEEAQLEVRNRQISQEASFKRMRLIAGSQSGRSKARKGKR